MKLTGLKEFLSQYQSGETRRAYRRDIIFFFRKTRKRPEKIKKMDVVRYISEIREMLSSASIHRMVSSVRSYMKFLVESDVIDKDPTRGLKLPRVYHREEDSITDTELKKIFSKSCKSTLDKRDRLIVCLMLYNGLRRSEICDLGFENISQENGVKILKIKGKGDKIRIRPLHPECWKALVSYLESSDRTIEKSGPIITTRAGKKIYPQVVYDAVKRVERGSGIKRSLHPHMFRSKFASDALESGVPITSVQEDMGHSSIETTAIYDHAKRRADRSAILRIKPVKDR